MADEENTTKVLDAVLQVIVVLSYRSMKMKPVVVKLKRFVSLIIYLTPQIHI